MFQSKKQFPLLVFFCCLFFLSQNIFSQSKNWREISPADLQLASSRVEPNADAEAIFWEVRVDDSTENLVMRHYIRVKIFTERGREKYSKIDIPYIQ